MVTGNHVPDDFSGVISIWDNHTPLFQNAYGYADIANRVPNTIDTKFATASAGKVFTAAAILQLIERGALALDESIGNVLKPDLKAINPGITIRQLLTHSSGMPDYFDEAFMSSYEELWIDYPNYKIRKSSDLLPLFINKPMVFNPGERFLYNDAGYVLLGLVIESVSGMPFDKHLKHCIFDPCNMEDTGYYELDRLPAHCACSYIFEANGEWRTNIYSVDVKGSGAGGAFTTVLDLTNFWRNLFGGKLIKKSMVREMINVQSASAAENHYYGYGVWLKKTSQDRFLPFVQGEDPGVCCNSIYDYEKNICITIVSNTGVNVWNINNAIMNELGIS